VALTKKPKKLNERILGANLKYHFLSFSRLGQIHDCILSFDHWFHESRPSLLWYWRPNKRNSI